MAIERDILTALNDAEKGSKQEAQARALHVFLQGLKADGFEDVSVENKSSKKVQETPPKREITTKLQRFTKEQKEELKKEGAVIVVVGNVTIAESRAAKRKFYATWSRGKAFENAPSRHSEVAIFPDPSVFFIEDSFEKTLEEQEKFVEKFSADLQKKVSGVEAIIPEAPDWVETVFQYLDATKGSSHLFGEAYEYRMTRTCSMDGKRVVSVGGFGAQRGLNMSATLPTSPLEKHGVAKFVVPSPKSK